MKDEKKVTNFKETEDMETVETEVVDEVTLTPGEKLDYFLIKHGPKIKAAAIGLLSIAAIGIGYMIMEGLKGDDDATAGTVDGNSFDSAGESVNDVIDHVTDGVNITNF